jgi:hypothetical protein
MLGPGTFVPDPGRRHRPIRPLLAVGTHLGRRVTVGPSATTGTRRILRSRADARPIPKASRPLAYKEVRRVDVFPYPARLEFHADRNITRWRPLVQWCLRSLDPVGGRSHSAAWLMDSTWEARSG